VAIASPVQRHMLIQSGKRYTQRQSAVGGTFQPSSAVPSVISAQCKGVPRSVCPLTTRPVPTDFSWALLRPGLLGSHRPKPPARAIPLGNIEAALAQDGHEDCVGHAGRRCRDHRPSASRLRLTCATDSMPCLGCRRTSGAALATDEAFLLARVLTSPVKAPLQRGQVPSMTTHSRVLITGNLPPRGRDPRAQRVSRTGCQGQDAWPSAPWHLADRAPGRTHDGMGQELTPDRSVAQRWDVA
jgi:hypothetical protein